MNQITVNFAKTKGAIKPMHAVNNGPVYKFAEDQRITNIDSFRDAGIPYARTHDASFNSTYGGEHTVDIHAIFPDFDKDPYDPESYDFELTDEYLKVIDFAGVEVFYRLGSKIEHWSKKYGTLPPKDFKKWAVICEHIIRHYTEGWADGFHYNIQYWEIWNEPDLDPDDSTHKRTWGGTKAQFFELYHIAATHLKACFPHLKIGGPALASKTDWAEDFLKQLKAPLDFFSWHAYAREPQDMQGRVQRFRALLDKYGYTETESILNEWNYVKGWEGEKWIYTLRREKDIKGAAFIASVMTICQKSPLDMLMYYDARPCGMNGMFNTDLVCDVLKGYYPFKMFNTLYKLGQEVETTDDEHLYACAATDGEVGAVMLTHYCDDDEAAPREVKIDFSGFKHENGVKLTWYILDNEHDLTLMKEELFGGDTFSSYVKMPLFTSLLIKIEKL